MFGIRGGFSVWMTSFFSFLNISHIKPTVQLVSKFHITLLEDKTECTSDDFRENYLQLVETSRLTSALHFQNVTAFTFSSGVPLCYRPGDILKIYPMNNDEDVDYVLSFFGFNCLKDKQMVELISMRPDATVPTHINKLLKAKRSFSVKEFLTSVVHISNYSPDQEFFEGLYVFLEPLLGKFPIIDLWLEKFKELFENYDEYLYYCYRPKRRIIDILREFSISSDFSFKMFEGNYLSIDCFLDIFPWIVPRQFSISSAMEKNSYNVSITVAIVEYSLGRLLRKGCCSTFLNTLKQGARILGCVENNTSALAFPNFSSTEQIPPLILLCSGTGIAPMRSFLEYCYFKMAENSLLAMKIYLVFGCRYQQKDGLYLDSEVFLSLIERGILTVFCKGSRDNPQLPKKVYLQNLIIENRELFQDLIMNQNACIYLSGNTKLPKAVRESLVSLIGENHMAKVEDEKRFQVECW